MDFDAEESSSLEEIYQKITNPTIEHVEDKKPIVPQSLDEKFDIFEQNMLNEFGGLNGHPKKKYLNAYAYFQRAQADIPEIIENQFLISMFSREENTFFPNAIRVLRELFLDRYNNVTIDTLARIHKSIEVPRSIKKYIIDTIPYESYKCIEFPRNCHISDFHGNTDLAATIENDLFQIWDLKTGEKSFLPKKALSGWIKFSDDGLNIITATLYKEEPKIIHIDIWDSISKKLIHTIVHSTLISRIIMQTEATKDKTLWIFDAYGISIYILKKDLPLAFCSRMNLGIEISFDGARPNTDGDYKLSGSTLSKKCLAYFLCSKAIQNTTNKDTLQKIRSVTIYEQLTPLEKNLIEREIAQKAENLIHSQKSILQSLFG